MTCPRCQAENRDGARFCRECGATFGAVCPGCGAKVESGSRFCDSCGAPLATAPAQPTASPRFASPESSDLHMDYTAVGQTTQLAARLEQMAMPGSILISPETLNLAEGYVVVTPLGERPIKGLETPIEPGCHD